MWFSEVKRSSCNGTEFTGRYKGGINRCKGLCIYHQLMIKDISISCSMKVKICMIGNVENTLFIRSDLIINHYFVLIVPCVIHFHVHISRIALFHIVAQIGKFYRRVFRFFGDLCIPHNAVPSSRTSVKCIRPVIKSKGIFLPVNCKITLCYPVGIAANNRTKIWIAVYHRLKRIKSEGDIFFLPFPVRNFNPCNPCTKVCEFQHIAILVCQGKKEYVFTLMISVMFFFYHFLAFC